jgi:RNA polymerase sigma factor (sigma-70 family)
VLIYNSKVLIIEFHFLKIIQNIKNYSDNELIKNYKGSEDSLFVGELFERYTRFVFLVCMKYLKDEESSKDAVMQIFEKLLTDLKNHEILNFKPWLHTVTKNHCLLYIRGLTYKQKKYEDLKNNQPKSVENVQDLHLNDESTTEEKIKSLQGALNELNEDQKICVDLFYLQDKSYQEIVDLTGFSMNQVKSFIQNGKRNLKNFLTKIKTLVFFLL